MSICDSSKCTSCMACYNICPKNCISMNYDEYGILSPQINEDVCIHCNLCKKICPVNNELKRNEAMEAYASWSLDEENRKSSSSGGLASIFYAHFIREKNGVIFGCSYDKDLQLVFSSAKTLEELNKYKTSKYSHAYIGQTYKEAEKELKNDKYVLFIGTPCQIAGLKSYLRKDYEKLLTIDLVCHGVPSQKYLDDYINSLDLPEKPDNLTFRGKYNYFFSLYKNGNLIYSKESKQDNFFNAFLLGLFSRENCYSCDYTSTNRISDITIGDFWGLGKEIPFEHEEKNGVSLVLINNEKGKMFFNEIKDKIFFEQRSLQEAIDGNDQLRHPLIKHEKNNMFLKIYQKDGIKKALEETLN